MLQLVLMHPRRQVCATTCISTDGAIYATPKDFRISVWDNNKIKLVNYEADNTTDLRLSTRYENALVFETDDVQRLCIQGTGASIFCGNIIHLLKSLYN